MHLLRFRVVVWTGSVRVFATGCCQPLDFLQWKPRSLKQTKLEPERSELQRHLLNLKSLSRSILYTNKRADLYGGAAELAGRSKRQEL